ncbi:hypothetical protein NUACC26_096260 [Scytonema sp. NUACC26]
MRGFWIENSFFQIGMRNLRQILHKLLIAKLLTVVSSGYMSKGKHKNYRGVSR